MNVTALKPSISSYHRVADIYIYKYICKYASVQTAILLSTVQVDIIIILLLFIIMYYFTVQEFDTSRHNERLIERPF